MDKKKNDISLEERVKNEKEVYHKGLDREKYNARFGHAFNKYSVQRRNKIYDSVLKKEKGKVILEIGSSAWTRFIDFKNYTPSHLICINISKEELEKGKKEAKKKNTHAYTQHDFIVMDAHKLKFNDETFDIIFGREILHHLDYDIAAKEMARVLKKGGEIVFLEPLDRNPVGKLVRYLTPNKRTKFEKPVDKHELDVIGKYFDLELTYNQLFQVPAGAISRFIFKKPNNRLTHGAYKLDVFLEEKFKNTNLGLYYRQVIIKGAVKK